jgi:hypothetical protein
MMIVKILTGNVTAVSSASTADKAKLVTARLSVILLVSMSPAMDIALNPRFLGT